MKRLVLSIAAMLGTTFLFASTSALGDDDRSRHEDGRGAITAPLMVVDANGKAVGKFGGGPGNPFVQLKLGHSTFAVYLVHFFGNIDTGRFDRSKLSFRDDSIYFPTTNCTGDAFVVPRDGVGIQQAAVFRDGSQRVWLYPIDGNEERGRLVFSRLNPLATACSPASGTADSGDGALQRISGAPIEITGHFKAPLAVR
jgi:hypothetical protein